MTTDPTALPPERLGTLLRRARRDAGLNRRRAARYAEVTVPTLLAFERGWELPRRSTFDRLIDAYGVTVDQLIPIRIPLKIVGTAMSAGSRVDVAASTARDDMLRTYIDLITSARASGTLDALTLRQSDIEQLASLLDTDEAVLAARIAALLGCSTEDASTIGSLLRTFAGPVIGVTFTAAVIGGSAVAGNTSGATLRRATDPPNTPVVVEATGIQLPSPSSTVTQVENTGAPLASNSTAGAAAVVVRSVVPTVGTTPVVEAPSPSPAPAPYTATGPTSTTTPTPDIGILPGEEPTQIVDNG